MNRRFFLRTIAAASAGAVIDPEQLLWVPGQKTIFDLHTPHRYTPIWVNITLDTESFFYGYAQMQYNLVRAMYLNEHNVELLPETYPVGVVVGENQAPTRHRKRFSDDPPTIHTPGDQSPAQPLVMPDSGVREITNAFPIRLSDSQHRKNLEQGKITLTGVVDNIRFDGKLWMRIK